MRLWFVVTILPWLLAASTVGNLCGTRPVCRISELDLRTAVGGLRVLLLEPADRYVTVQIQRLQIGTVPVAALLVNASTVAETLEFKTFRENSLILASALALRELVLAEAPALAGFTAQRNTYLRRLEINSCAITVLPPTVRNLVKLQDFTLRRCPIQMLNLALLEPLRQLETAMFLGHRISGIHPPLASSVQNIHELDLSQNQLTQLNVAALAPLKQLRSLYVANNQLDEITYGGAAVVAFPQLTVLNLFKNRLRSISLGQLDAPSLEYLQASVNNLTTVPGPLGKFPKLSIVALNGNALESLNLGLFAGLRELTCLELSANRLQTLEASRGLQLPRLNVLQLSSNRLTSANILEQLTLPRLGYLDLATNQLTVVPNVFDRDAPTLLMVAVMGNPLTCATLEAHRTYVQLEVLVPKWLQSSAELCSTGSTFVLNEKRRSCCAP